jgi:short subunit fatty acids transporter
MILGMIAGTGLSEKLAHAFSSVTSHNTFAVIVAAYSAGLGVLITLGRK